MPKHKHSIGANTLKITSGRVKGKVLRYLGYVAVCNKSRCPISNICTFKPEGKGQRCKVEYAFLNHIFNSWVDPNDGLGDVMDQVQVDRIGIHLIPLYSQLVRFAKETYGLASVSYRDDKGIVRAYPHFKEIRETIRMIGLELNAIGLAKLWREKFGTKASMPQGRSVADILQHGDQTIFDEMASDEYGDEDSDDSGDNEEKID